MTTLHCEAFRESVVTAYDTFCEAFPIKPGRLHYEPPGSYLMTAVGFDLRVTVTETITPDRVRHATKTLSPDGHVMRRPRLTKKGN